MHPVYLLFVICFSFLTFLFRVIHYVYLCTDEKLCPVWQPHKLFTCFALENPLLKQKITNVFILMKFSSLTALEVVKNAVSAENFIKAIDKMTLHFQTLDFCVNSVWILCEFWAKCTQWYRMMWNLLWLATVTTIIGLEWHGWGKLPRNFINDAVNH